MKRIASIGIILMLLLVGAGASSVQADVIEIAPLFEYPVAPDNLPDLESKSNFIITNFWRSFDFKSKPVGQIQLNHAFKVFSVPMRWATPQIVYSSVDELLKKLKKNPALLYQFTVAAEENLYGNRSEVWIDDVYLKFLNALVENKKVKKERKMRFALQKTLLENSLKGGKLAPFSYTAAAGEKKEFTPEAELTLLEFGSPTCSDCRMAKLKFDTDLKLEELQKAGRLKIVFIIPDAESEDDWQQSLASYPDNWETGAGDELDMLLDMRLVPSIYLIDAEGKVIEKNITADEAAAAVKKYLQ